MLVPIETVQWEPRSHHFPIPDYPFASLAMDFVKLPHTKVGATEFDFVFVIVDRLTGYTMGIPCLEERLTAEKAAGLIFRQMCFFYRAAYRNYVR